jgi:flagellar basal-body rod protein FlgG
VLDALGAAKDGYAAQSRRFDAIASDVANVSTPAHRVVRTDIDGRHGGGIEARVRQMWQQGPLVTTASTFDLAIVGDGFFKVRRQDGSLAYTRNGSFKLDAQRRLTTSSGEIVDPALRVPHGASDLRVARDGTVSAHVGGGRVELGRVELADFGNPEGLEDLGGGLYAATGASGEAQPFEGEIEQGVVEASGTDLLAAQLGLFQTANAYSALARGVRVYQETTGSLLDVLA